jgi:hypothetical protein
LVFSSFGQRYKKACLLQNKFANYFYFKIYSVKILQFQENVLPLHPISRKWRGSSAG